MNKPNNDLEKDLSELSPLLDGIFNKLYSIYTPLEGTYYFVDDFIKHTEEAGISIEDLIIWLNYRMNTTQEPILFRIILKYVQEKKSLEKEA